MSSRRQMLNTVFTKRFFPEEYRAFANGPLSVCVDRFGGIESIHLLDIRNCNGRLYPALRAVEIFSRNGTILNRPFMTAAMYFENRRTDGTTFRYCPEYPEIHPVGVRSKSFRMRLKPDSMCVALNDPHPGETVILIGKPHYEWKHGVFQSVQNQNSRYQPSWLPNDQRGSDFNPNEPFPDTGTDLQKKPARFLQEENALVFEMDLIFCDHRKKLFAVLTSFHPLEYRECSMQWELSFRHDGSADLSVSMGFGETLSDALEAARDTEKNDLRYWQQETSPDRFPGMPEIHVEDLPEADAFLRKYPYYQAAAIVSDDGRYCCNRAAQNKYGYFAMWDQIFPLRDYLIMGNPEWTKRSLRQIVTYPHVDSAILISLQTVPAANEYLAFTGDLDFIRELMPWFRKFFAFALKFCHPETGLIRNTMACAVDVPQELGVDGLFYEAGINGWWYDFCRGLQNMALSLKDPDLAEQCGKQADRILAHYVDFFYDPEEKFLLGIIPEKRTEKFIPVHVYTATMALEYAHGSVLLRKILPELADFQIRKLHHPMGHTAVPMDSRIPVINLKAFHMNQHLGHECICARMGGHPEEAMHMLHGYFSWCNFYQNAIETFNLCWCMGGGQSQNADWQTFSATGAMQALLHSAMGIAWHRGGLYYLPARQSGKIELQNLHFRNRRCSFRCSGNGPYVEKMQLGRISLVGTCQLPADLFRQSDTCSWEVVRSEQLPDRPLLLSAEDLPIVQWQSSPGTIEFRAGDTAFSSVAVFCPGEAVFSVNGEVVPAESCGNNVQCLHRKFGNNDLIQIQTTNRMDLK